MAAELKNAWGYQGDTMNLPVANVNEAVPFYERVFGFVVEARNDEPHRSAVLERNGIRMAVAENGADSSQDGCAFQVDDVDALFEEWTSNLDSARADDASAFPTARIDAEIKTEKHEDGSQWRVFFVIAPDGLCYWLGEKQSG